MVISILDGSPVLDANMEEIVRKQLRALVRKEQQVTLYFYSNNEFVFLCEWVARELQAAYPKKEMESVGVACDTKRTSSIPQARYTRRKILTRDPKFIWKWMVNQADFVICHMDLLLCNSRDRVVAYQYACSQKHERCINLCSDWEMQQVREQIGTLVGWEHEVFAGKMYRDRKAAVAERLGVSKATVRFYEIAAQRRLIRRISPQAKHERQCAVFCPVTYGIESDKIELLTETIGYLKTCCGVSKFIVSCRAPGSLMRLIKGSSSDRDISVMRMQRKNNNSDTIWKDNGEYTFYREPCKSYVNQFLEEKHAMIDISDIVLCDAPSVYRSGLNYARKRRVPFINLSAIAKP